MLGICAFIIGIVSAIMSFFSALRLPSFLIAILGIIIGIISAYDKDVVEKKENASKDSRALEIGTIIISGASALSYYGFLIIALL